jgi:hypothetical protein
MNREFRTAKNEFVFRTSQFAVCLCGLLVGCRSEPDDAKQRTPLETIRQLIEARDAGAYQRFDDLVVAQRAEPLVRTLIAIDRFLVANRRLCAHVRDQFTSAHAAMIDQSYFADALEVFSPKVRLIDQRIEDGIAIVSFMSGERLPLKRARLVRVDGAWRYDPGAGYDPDLPEAFERMAEGLDMVLADLKSGRISADQINSDPEALGREVMLRLTPGVKSLPAAPATTRP